MLIQYKADIIIISSKSAHLILNNNHSLFIRPSRDGPYYVIGYGGRASTQVSAQYL